METPEALVKLCEDGAKFDGTRTARVLCDGPHLSECGYASAHTFRTYSHREMKVPLDGGNVERQAIKQDNVESILKNSGKVIKSSAGGQLLRAVQFARNVPRMKPDTIDEMRKTWPDITMAEALQKKRAQKETNVLAFVTHEMKMPVTRIGMLGFSDNEERKHKDGERVRLGEITERYYRDKNGKIKWCEMRDEFTDPRGYGTVSRTWDEKEAAKRGWLKSPNQAGVLSGALSFGNNHQLGATLQPANSGSMANSGIMDSNDDSLDDQTQTHHGRDKLQESPEDLLLRCEISGLPQRLSKSSTRCATSKQSRMDSWPKV